MKYSVIVPTFNSEKYLNTCLSSIISSESDESFEIIAVDGGSTDNTLQIISSFPEVKLVHSSNKSIANSRNLGVAASTGEILIFIDSDCQVNKYLLTKSKEHLQKHHCYGSFYKANDSQGWIAKVWLDVERKKDGKVKWLTSGTLAVSRKVFDKLSGFDESLQTEEDEDFCHRVRGLGGELLNDSSVASIHLGQPDSIFPFFQKEAWRGKSLVKPLSKLTTSRFSLFDTIVFLYFISLMSVFFSFLDFRLLYVSVLSLLLIPLLFSIRITLRNNINNFLGVYFLYFVFFLARSWSILRYKQLIRLFS